MPREKMKRGDDRADAARLFFSEPTGNLEFIHSGCRVLDRVLGGGWALGRIANIVGNQSTGKTLLAIEACANFALRYPEGEIYYREREHAFDEDYASALGMPIDRIQFVPDGMDFETVEDAFNDLDAITVRHQKSGKPALYILDSLDALSDEGEIERKITDGSYGGQKPKQVGAIFRRLIGRLGNVSVIIISQVRDNPQVTWGNKQRRSGGKALDFYASQVLWLHHVGRIKHQVHEIERVTGVRIKAKCEKNKIGLPFRECEFEIVFGYGLDDITACAHWLKAVKRTEIFGNSIIKYVDQIKMLQGKEYRDAIADLHAAVDEAWKEVEIAFLPKTSKYR